MDKEKPWLKSYPKEIPKSIQYDEIPLYNFLLESGERHKQKKALHFMGKEISFGELLSRAKQMANFLQSIGLKKGDRVASMLPNCTQAVITYYGTMMDGVVVVVIKPIFSKILLDFILIVYGVEFH